VEGLKPENVTITDTQMRVLSKGAGEDTVAELTGTQIEMKRQVERYLQDKIETMLAGVLGPGKAAARVSVELDFEHLERTEETYDSENPVIRSEQIKEETNKEYASGTGAAGGGGVPAGTLTSEKTQTETITNYELSRTMERYVKPAGSIKRLSAAVVVDGTYEGEGASRQYKPRSSEEMKKIEELVKAAVGFDAARGDEVSVANVPFSVSEYEEGTSSGGALPLPYLVEMGKRLGVIIFALLVLMLLRSKIKQLLSKPVEIPYSVAVEGEEAVLYGQQQGGPGDGRKLREQAGRIAQEKPELVVRLLRNWMLEE